VAGTLHPEGDVPNTSSRTSPAIPGVTLSHSNTGPLACPAVAREPCTGSITGIIAITQPKGVACSISATAITVTPRKPIRHPSPGAITGPIHPGKSLTLPRPGAIIGPIDAIAISPGESIMHPSPGAITGPIHPGKFTLPSPGAITGPIHPGIHLANSFRRNVNNPALQEMSWNLHPAWVELIGYDWFNMPTTLIGKKTRELKDVGRWRKTKEERNSITFHQGVKFSTKTPLLEVDNIADCRIHVQNLVVPVLQRDELKNSP
jgi:hypothetical protein